MHHNKQKRFTNKRPNSSPQNTLKTHRLSPHKSPHSTPTLRSKHTLAAPLQLNGDVLQGSDLGTNQGLNRRSLSPHAKKKHSLSPLSSTPSPQPPTTTSRRHFNHSTKQPLSYRHLYHAGNHADVMKHAILLTLAAQQARKIPFGRLFIDTHAGPGGTYDLQHEYARKTEEFAHGIGRIYDISRLSALNPHITSETTLRRNEINVDYGYTQDPLYLRLQSPASDLFNPFPFINGLASPGAKTISPAQNQSRGELTIPLMTNPHPLLIAGGDDVVAGGIDNQIKESYMSRIQAMPKKQVLSARRKLQRQLTRIRSQLQSLKNQQNLIKTLKKEFAMLGMQESIQMAKSNIVIEEPSDDNSAGLVNLNNFEEETDVELLEELNLLNSPDDDNNDENTAPSDPDDRDLPMQDVNITVHTVDEGNNAQKANASSNHNDPSTNTQKANPLRSSRPRLNSNIRSNSNESAKSDAKAPSQLENDTEMIAIDDGSHKKRNFKLKNNQTKVDSNPKNHQNKADSGSNPSFHPNFPRRGPVGTGSSSKGDNKDNEESSEIEDDLLNAHADRQYTGPVPEVGLNKVKDYTNKHGERVTFRKIGKSVVDVDGKVKTVDNEGNVIDERALFVKKNISVEPMRLYTGGFQEDPIKARKRTVNTLTKRLVSAYDPIEEVGESIHELNVAMHIPSKNNNLINQSNLQTPSNPSPSHDPTQLSITRTNQLHTTQLSVYLRHLLPIPSSMLPYISAMTHGSKPPTLSSIMERPSYADLLVGDAITKEKAKALQERQDRDTHGGNFTTSVKLTKDEKTLFLKEVVNGSILEGYLNNADSAYHDVQHEVISDHLQRGIDELEKERLPISEFSRRATALVGSNMVSFRPHHSLPDPKTSQSFIPLTMMEDEWIHGINDIRPNNPGLKSISQTNAILTDDLVYPTSTRVPAHAILYAPNPTKRAEQMKKQQSRRSHAVNLNNEQLRAPTQGFEVDMQYGLDEIPANHRGDNNRRFKDRNGHGDRFGDRGSNDRNNNFGDRNKNFADRGNNDRNNGSGGRFGDRNNNNDRNGGFGSRNDRDHRENRENHRESRENRRPTSSSPLNEAAEMGINPNILGGNISVKMNSFEEDQEQKRIDRQEDGDDRRGSFRRDNGHSGPERSFQRRENNNNNFDGDNNDRPFRRENNNNFDRNDRDNRSFRGHGDSERPQRNAGFNDRRDDGGFSKSRFNNDRNGDGFSRDRNGNAGGFSRERNDRNSGGFPRSDRNSGFSRNNDNFRPGDRNTNDNGYKPRDKDSFVSKFDNKDRNSSSSSSSPPSKKTSSLRDLKYSTKPTQGRSYTTLNQSLGADLKGQMGEDGSPTSAQNNLSGAAPSSSRLLRRRINRSQLPPTLRALAPLARLGVINPGMVSMVLRRHFSSQIEAGNVWKDIMKQDKKKASGSDNAEKPSEAKQNIWKTMYDSEKSDFKKNYNHNDVNPTNPKFQQKKQENDRKFDKSGRNGKFGDKKSKFNGDREGSGRFSDRRDNNDSKFAQKDKFSSKFPQNHQNDENNGTSTRRVTPLGDSRRSRDKARAKEERLAIWEREAPSTEMIGIDKIQNEEEKSIENARIAKEIAKDAAKRDSMELLNSSFVEYPFNQPQLVPKASVKSLYTSSMTPIDKLTQMYFTSMSKSRKQKQKRQNTNKEKEKNLAKNTKNGTNPSIESLLSLEDELQTYRDELDQSVSVLFDEDADSNERFTALQNYEKYYSLAEDALSYLTRSLSVYRSDDKLFHIPLAQPLYSSPSSPWLMTNMLRDEIFAPTADTWTDSDTATYQKRLAANALKNSNGDDDNDDDLKVLPNHLPMIKDVLVLNELHTTEYQTLRKNNGDTIMGGFYKEAVNDHIMERLEDVLDIKTSTTTTLRQNQIEPDVVPKVPEKALSQNDFDALSSIESPHSASGKHQRAQRVPANSNTLGDAIGRLAATVVTDSTMGFNPLMHTIGQKYANFNTLPVPVTPETHGAHNIFLDKESAQIVALQYNGFSSAQIFLKQFQYYTDFVSRMSYSALNPNSPGVQQVNKIHDDQYREYEQRYDQRDQNGNAKHPMKKIKNDNFISTSLMLCDPAYETGEEYVNVLDLLRTTMDFNARGNAHTLAIWYPILEKIDPSLPDAPLPTPDNDENRAPDHGKFDMSTVARRDINRGHFLNALTRQFEQTPKHEHHKLFLSMSSMLVNKYRSTLPSPALSQTPYNMQAPTGNLDTVIAETYVGIPKNIAPQRKNIYMSGSGMMIHSPILPQELDQSLSTMLPWISTALHVDSFNNIYNHVVKTKQMVHKQRMAGNNGDGEVVDVGENNNNNDSNRDKNRGLIVNGGADLTTTELPPLADYTLHWL